MQPEKLRGIYQRQAKWFAGERGRLLRKINLPAKDCVLDLGAGTGEMLAELDRRARGFAVGLDADASVLSLASGRRVAGMAESLPFPGECFDLIFTQMFFLWANPLAAVISEIRRVLKPGGHLLAVAEPDYGGAVEHPNHLRTILACAKSLAKAGAEPEIGRKLAGELKRQGLEVKCGVHPSSPIDAAQPDSIFAAPEVMEPSKDLEFLFVPFFHFQATKK